MHFRYVHKNHLNDFHNSCNISVNCVILPTQFFLLVKYVGQFAVVLSHLKAPPIKEKEENALVTVKVSNTNKPRTKNIRCTILNFVQIR